MGSPRLFLQRRLTTRVCVCLSVAAIVSFLATAGSIPAQTSAISVPLLLPSAIAFDASGNLYIAETAKHVIRKVDASGNMTTVAGTGTQGYDGDNGQATLALLDSPGGLAVDATGLYIADTHNHRIRKVDLASGIITTIAGISTAGAGGDNDLARKAMLDRPVALTLDAKSNLYLADAGSHRVRRIDAVTGIITTVAGAGIQGYGGDSRSALSALLDSPEGLAVDTSGNLYLSDTHNQRIRRVDVANGTITTIAGTGGFGYAGDLGASAAARLALPRGLSVDSQGNIYVADSANHRVRRIDIATGEISTIAGDGKQGFAGDGGAPEKSSLSSPRATGLSTAGQVTIADTGNGRVRQVSGGSIQTIAGLGAATPVSLVISGDAAITYGSGQIAATLISPGQTTGAVIFSDQFTGNSGSTVTVPVASNAAVLDTSTLPAGEHIITAAYGGDSTHLGAQSAKFSLTIHPLPITALISPASLQYGEEIPPITGGLVGVLSRDQSAVSVSVSADASAHPSAGSYPLKAILTGAAAGNYTLSDQPVLTITKARTATAITATTASLATATSADAGQPVLLRAHVTSATSGTPSGTIILSDGGALLAAGNANASGDLTFTTSALSTGPHSLYATYSGDPNFLSSTSPSALFTVSAPTQEPGDFTLASSSATTQTIVSGSSANFSFVVHTQGSLSSPVSLSASGFPDLATASFNPGNIPAGTVSGNVTMTIATPKTAQLFREKDLAGFLVLVLPCVTASRRRRIRTLLVVLLTAPLLLISGCGDRVRTGTNTETPTKSYTITVIGTATDNTGAKLQHTTTVTLILQAAS
jgi:sugar lactone lactonase YvrE